MDDTTIDLERRGGDIELYLRLTPEQAAALGLERPQAGTKVSIEADATIVRAATSDPDGDGDVDAYAIDLRLSRLSVTEGAMAEPDSMHLDSRAAALLYKRRRAMTWSATKIDERDVGGSGDIGEFGQLNRRVGG